MFQVCTGKHLLEREIKFRNWVWGRGNEADDLDVDAEMMVPDYVRGRSCSNIMTAWRGDSDRKRSLLGVGKK